MSQYAESSGVGGSRSRLGGARSSRLAWGNVDPVGDLSGFPLVPCPYCGLARVVEGRTKKENDNHGRLYFKCPRNEYPKLCNYYRFEKYYFEDLKARGIIIVRPSNWAELEVEEEEDAVDSANVGKPNKEKELEQKMEKLIRKMNMCIILAVVVICVVFVASMK